MKLGLLIANLEMLATKRGRDFELSGLMLDEYPDESVEEQFATFLIAHEPNTPIIVFLRVCPDCGRPRHEHK